MFVIDSKGRVNPEEEYKISLGDLFEPYGFCLQKTHTNQLYAYVNDKSGDIFQIEINFENSNLQSRIVRYLKVSTQPEGMVVDDDREMLYIGEEQRGIHYITTNPTVEVKPKYCQEAVL
ncbi:MAG: phytase [Saprospiraceae bacterium]